MLNKREQSRGQRPGQARANRASGRASGRSTGPALDKSLVPVLVAELGSRLSEQLPPGLRHYGDDMTGHLVEQMLPPLPSSAPKHRAPALPLGGDPGQPGLREAPGDFTASVMARITFITATLDDAPDDTVQHTDQHSTTTYGKDAQAATAVRHRAQPAPSLERVTAPAPPALPLRVRVHAAAVTLGFILLLIATTAYVLARTEPGRLLAVAELFGGIGMLVLAFGRTLMPLVSLPLLGSLFALTSGATVLHLSEYRRQRAAEIRESEAA